EARAGARAQVADQVLDLAERARRGALEREPCEPAARAQHVLDQALDRALLPAVVLARLGEAGPQPGELALLAEPVVAGGRGLRIDARRAGDGDHVERAGEPVGGGELVR